MAWFLITILVIFRHILAQNSTIDLIQSYPSSLGDDRYPELSSRLYEGDILMPMVLDDDMKNALTIPSMKWPNGTVTYEFTSNYTDQEKDKVRKNMDLIESKTCVKFEPRSSENKDKTYILINKQRLGCYAIVGYRPDITPIPVNYMSPECLLYSGTIQHELLHVLGLMHEQARDDRDEHVEIIWENIEENHYTDFSKAPPGTTTTHGVPYSTMSVMHYPNIAFSKNGKATIVSKKDPKMEMGQRVGMTEGDVEKVRKMYNCKNGNDTQTTQGTGNTFLNIFNIFKP